MLSINKARLSAPRAKPLIIVLAVGLAGFLGWWYFYGKSTTDKRPPVTPADKYSSVTPSQKADTMAFQGNYQGAQNLLDDEIARSDDAVSKRELYLDKWLIAFNKKQYNDALSFAQAAEKLAPTRVTAKAVAQSSEALNNKKLALEYYKKVVERTPQSMKDVDETINVDVEAKIKELSQ